MFDGRDRRAMALRLRRNAPFLAVFAAVYLFVCFALNIFPGYLPFLGADISTLGEMQCLVNTGLSAFGRCANMGYPLGHPITIGLPLEYIGALIQALSGRSIYFAFVAANGLFLLVAMVFLHRLWLRLGVNRYVSLFVSYLFFTSLIVLGEFGYGPMRIAFALMPTYVYFEWCWLSAIEAFPSRGHWARSVVVPFLLAAGAKTVALFMDGYSFMIASLATSCLLAAFLLSAVRKREYARCIAGVLGYAGYNAAAVLLYKHYLPGGGDFGVMPLDFFRGQGVDLITLVAPSKTLQFFYSTGLYPDWNPLQFYSDGPNMKFMYVGVFLLIALAAFAFLLWKGRIGVDRWFAALLVSATAAFLLSLGPSLKINDKKSLEEISHERYISFQDYRMPAEKATLNLHTGRLYLHVPGVRVMRALYRWQLLTRFALLAVLASVLTALLAARRRALLLALGLGVFIELMPVFQLNVREGRNFYHMLGALRQDVVLPMSTHVSPKEKVFFYSNTNDFLADYLAPNLDLLSYNTGGDKNMVMAAPSWPPEILQIRQQKNIKENLHTLFQRGALDAMIVPYFHMLWSAYRWPPPETLREQMKAEWQTAFGEPDARFRVSSDTWFAVVRPAR